jgi:hypothetical protein
MAKRRQQPDIPATRTAWPPGGGEVGELIRARDWDYTSLGPTSAWPLSLRWATELVLASSIPRAVLWGADLVQIYNDSFCAAFMESRHPAALGQPTRECWPEVFPRYEPYYARVLDGESLVAEDLLARQAADVIQEALTNIARHAEARTATIHLLADDGVLTVAIRDDGIGVAISNIMAATGGLGGCPRWCTGWPR